MKINTIKIKNFRGIPDMEISLERISFFTGPCGAGKTSVLKAFNFALTGDVKKDDIREQSDRASATIVFEDQSSIQRICKLSAATQVKVNGKNSTAKAADEFLQAKLGTSTDIFQAMCKTDFFEVLSQKEQTEFFLSILPTKISFEKLCEFIGENNKKLTEEEKTTLKTAFANISDPFGLDEIDMAYKYFYQKRKEKKAFVDNLKPRAVFDMSILPEESKENLQKSLEDVIRKETLAKEYQKNLNEYNRQVKMKADSDVRLKKLKEEYQKYSSVEKPDPDYKEKQESEKKQFENAIHNCQTAISTIKGNLELLEKTLKSLNTNVCPISSRLICTSDRTPLKSEFEDQIQKSKDGIKKNTDFIKRCEKEVQIRTERLDAYQKQQISYNNKKNLHDQIQNYVPITVMEKPEEVKAPDMMVKQEIQSKISKYTSFENAKKAKCELEEEQKKLRILENLVLYLDSKTGVRGYILKKVVEPFTKMCNQKASKFHNMELKISFDNGIEFYGKTENSNGFVPIHRLSSGEHVFATYLLCTLINQITKATVTFTFNTNGMAGGAYVAFEEVYETTGGKETLWGTHMDLNDEAQTVYVPSISTNLIDEDSQTNYTYIRDNVKAHDLVTYEGLIAGKTYKLTGTLVEKSTGKTFVDANGKTATITQTFTPDSDSGSVDMVFDINPSNLKTSALVAFETLSCNGEQVTIENDLDNEQQTLHFPILSTTAKGKVSGKNYVDIGGDMSIIDTIKYEGVQYGMTHTIKTYLVDKSTGKTVKDDNGNDIVKTTEWEPEATQGSIDVEIPVTGKKLAGRTLVVFEEIYLGDAMIACHKDINDANQTIKVKGYRDCTVIKRIKADDYWKEHGDPTFIFKLTGTDTLGASHTYYQSVTFTESYVKAHTDSDGYVEMKAIFGQVPAGEYTCSEESVSRFEFESLTKPVNATINGKTAVYHLTDNDTACATFANKKYEEGDFGHDSVVVNHFNHKTQD